jgi:predicted MFS family arabinose efflux permease
VIPEPEANQDDRSRCMKAIKPKTYQKHKDGHVQSLRSGACFPFWRQYHSYGDRLRLWRLQPLLQPLLPAMGASFGRSGIEAGLIATLTQLGYAVGLFLFVPLGDKTDRKRLILSLLALNILSLAGTAFAPTFAMLSLASFAVGTTAITAQIIIPAVSGSATPAERGRVVGTLVSGLSSGLLFARTLSGLVGAHAGWRAVFVMAVILDAGLMAIVWPGLSESESESKLPYPALLASLCDLLRGEPVLRAACLTGFSISAAFSALWGTLASLLARQPYGFGSDVVGAFGFLGIARLLASP